MRELRKKNMWDIKRQQGEFVKQQEEGKLGGVQGNWLENDCNNPSYINGRNFGLLPFWDMGYEWIEALPPTEVTLATDSQIVYRGNIEGFTECEFFTQDRGEKTGFYNANMLYRVNINGKEFSAFATGEINEETLSNTLEEPIGVNADGLYLVLPRDAQRNTWYPLEFIDNNGGIWFETTDYEALMGEEIPGKITISIKICYGGYYELDPRAIPSYIFPTRVEIQQMIADAIAELQNT